MQVNGISNTYQTSAAGNNAKVSSSTGTSLDSNQFMQILMAQLTHQNPLEPMDSNQMMSQFSQLNSLQELKDIHTAMDNVSVTNQTTYLTSLIGKKVKVNRPDGKVLEGVVDGVLSDKDNPQILIGTERVDLTDVLEIKGESV
jgi:flagellar basal-body rod modification protein FlgD